MLGDLSCTKPQDAFDVLPRLNGIKHLVSGNHDNCSSIHKQGHKWLRPYLEHVESVQDFSRRKVNDTEVLLSHYPYSGEGDRGKPDRYTQFRLKDEGSVLLHGHTHSTTKISLSVEVKSLQIHVGWDAWDKLVSLSEIAQMIKDYK